MHSHSLCATAVILSTIFCVGCASVSQKNLDANQLTTTSPENGVIVGSVTAPFASRYHETVLFEYRRLGDGDKNSGVITSGTQHKNFLIDIPACDEGGLPQQCGRLFAISLPAGNYEIYRARVMHRDYFQSMQPAVFNVGKGKVSYLGNLSVTFCEGMVSRHRGNILGADVSIKDEYERDIALIRKHFSGLQNVSVEKRLLPDHSWNWRVAWKALFRGNVEPYDWGGCGGPSPNKTPKPTH